MAQDDRAALTIWRRPRVQTETGYSRSTLYLRIAQGLWPKPVRLGVRAVGWPAGEVAALNAARIAGQPRRGTTRPGGTSRSPPPDGIQWSVVRAWLCNAPGFYGHPMHRLATMPRRDAVPAVAFPVRGAAPHGACAETGRGRRGARQAGPIREPCRTTSGGARLDGHGRWPVATDRAQPPRPRSGRRRDRRSPPVAPAALYDEGWLARTLGLAPSLQGTTDGQRRLGCRPAAHGITR